MIEWRPVYGFEGIYEVTDFGMIRRISNGRILNPLYGRKGYRYYRLSNAGESIRQKEHRVVASAFLGFFPGLLVRHLDGNPANNSLENLAWGTAQDNTNDRIAMGRRTGLNHLKTQCPRGHEYSVTNTLVNYKTDTGRPYRRCRTCRAAQARERAARTA